MISQANVEEFHRKFGLEIDAPDSWILRTRRLRLLDEEYRELQNALLGEDLEQIAKEGADLIYVILGTFVSLGIFGSDSFDRVHRSNMSKLWSDGKPRYDANGKVVKPPTYEPPSMEGVVR